VEISFGRNDFLVPDELFCSLYTIFSPIFVLYEFNCFQFFLHYTSFFLKNSGLACTFFFFRIFDLHNFYFQNFCLEGFCPKF